MKVPATYVLVILSLIVGCARQAIAPEDGPAPILQLLAPGSVRVGESAEFTLLVENPGTVPLVLEISAPPAHVFDPIVLRRDDEVVWRSWSGLIASPTLPPIVIPPGETLSFSHVWNLTDDSGELVQPGEYRVRVFFHRSRGLLRLDDHSITVLP